VMVIAADGSAHKHSVSLGIQTAATVQVLSGVTATDSVITVGAYGLDDGMKVGVADNKPDFSETADKPGAGKKDDR